MGLYSVVMGAGQLVGATLGGLCRRPLGVLWIDDLLGRDGSYLAGKRPLHAGGYMARTFPALVAGKSIFALHLVEFFRQVISRSGQASRRCAAHL